MNIGKSIAFAASLATVFASHFVNAEVENITEGSTSGYTMTDGNTYVIQNSVEFSNATAGGSGMIVADNATVVLYVPKGVTLTATGANGSGQTGGGAGICVPESATLVITGEGTVNATGGNAGNGGKGANGSKGGAIAYHYGRYPDFEGSAPGAIGAAGKGSSGAGGTGGVGGGGAGAGIGGQGGLGGSGGNAGAARVISSYILNFEGNGNKGGGGGNGMAGAGMGVCCILGNMALSVTGGKSGTAGSAGNKADWNFEIYDYYSDYYFSTCGGGGGGGGGAGSAVVCAIGGGGSSGGGGGGGGSGATNKEDEKNYEYHPMVNANGGGGAGGKSTSSAGGSGVAKGKTVGGYYNTQKTSYYYGGEGGAGGASGAEGGAGTLYVSSMATVNVNRATLSAETHIAAQYAITFDVNGGELSSPSNTVTATLGCALPDCIDVPVRSGYLFAGWFDDSGTQYYGCDGTKVLSTCAVPGDTVLHAVWEIDVDKVVIPDNPFWLRENAAVGWFVDSAETDGGCMVLRSGEIGSNTNSWMETSIVGPASFSFDWRVSCNSRGHYLLWSIDGVEQGRIKGVTDWAAVSASIAEGLHVIRFDYVKGSTSASGDDKGQVRNFVIDPVRLETESVQILWDWTTNYWVAVSATGFGTADFASGWIATGSNLVVNVEPSIHSYRIELSGDTIGVELVGTQLGIPVENAARIIGVAIEEVRPRLVVVSPQGASDPAVGEHEYASDVEVTVSAIAPEPVNGVRAVCTGWTGTGSVPAFGDGNAVTFCITNDSSITWNWSTGYWVEFSIVGKGTSAFESQWVREGTELTIPFTVNAPFYSLALSGDDNGVVLTDGSIAFVADQPRTIVLTIAEFTYGGVLDDLNLRWTSGGAVAWEAQTTISHDGEDAVKSGQVTGDDVSTLSTVVAGPGTFSWWWRLDMTDCAGVEVFIDNMSVAALDDARGWTQKSVEIHGAGNHVVKFEFWNAGTGDALSDCAYLDQVSWNGEFPTTTSTSPVPVPYVWLDKYGLGGTIESYETAANSTAENGENTVWECYVAGLDPTKAGEKFRAVISSVDGVVKIDWEPKLTDEEEALRTYTVLGKADLAMDPDWVSPTNATHRFFKVKVQMK